MTVFWSSQVDGDEDQRQSIVHNIHHHTSADLGYRVRWLNSKLIIQRDCSIITQALQHGSSKQRHCQEHVMVLAMI